MSGTTADLCAVIFDFDGLMIDTEHQWDELLARWCGQTAAELWARIGAIGTDQSSPAPDIFLETAHRLGVPAKGCLVLESSVVGCQAALAAGMSVIACATVVTAHCEYTPEADSVSSLLHVSL